MPITLTRYSADNYSVTEVPTVAAALPLKDPKQVTWLDIDHHHHKTDLADIASTLGLHPVVGNNLSRKNQRAHVEYYGQYTVITAKMLRTGRGTSYFFEPLVIILGDGYITTVQAGRAGDVFEDIRADLQIPDSRIRQLGPDYLVYRLIDAMVDEYFDVLQSLDEEVEKVEETILKQADPATAGKLYRLKREVVALRKAVWPMREVVASLERNALPAISTDTQIYIRDTYEQLVQVIDGIESLRDLTSSMVEIYLSSVSNRMNSVIKVLTIITTIFMPLTLITGIYGMNIDALPGLHEAATPWLLMGALIVITLSMLAVFRYKRWL